MGYTSITDFFCSIFGLSYIKAVSFAGILTALTSIITNYIYDTPIAIYTLWALYSFDFVTGFMCAWKQGTISSAKLPRMIINLFFMTCLISISWWMANSLWAFQPLPGFIIGVAYSTLFISLLENLSKMNVLPKTVHEYILKHFSIHKIAKKLSKNEENS